MSGVPNVEQAILAALAEPQLSALAQQRFAAQAQKLFFPHKLELSASAAGACVLEKWASLHEKLDLPEEYMMQVIKMDGGTMYGARLAALFSVGFEDAYPGFEVDVEIEGEHDGIPGHVEIVIYDARARSKGGYVLPEGASKVTFSKASGNSRVAVHMVEIKTSFWGGAVSEHARFKHSKEFHIIQAAKEALIVSAPGFSILNVLPAATKRGGEKARHFIQDDFVTADYELAVKVEYGRLRRALDPKAPTGDATEPWRCLSCRFSACERNRNPLKLATA